MLLMHFSMLSRAGVALKANQPFQLALGMISEVGYLHENPKIEALLLRRGIQPLSEDEFLEVIDIALASEIRGRDPEFISHPYGIGALPNPRATG